MAETDILNPVQGYWPDLGDNPTWNYGYERRKSSNSQVQAARMGAPFSRDVANGGRIFTLSWSNRPLATMQRLERFYEDHKDGYFTLIDYDNNSRQHVGRFAEPPAISQVGHLSFTAQSVTFVERPRTRMLIYPSDFTLYGHAINALDDDLAPRIACMVGTWATQLVPGGGSITDPTQYEAFDAAGTLGDWAQMQYVGWGFRMVFRIAPTLGMVDVYLDGTLMVAGLDLSTGATTSTFGGTIIVVTSGGSPTVTISATSVSLDMHRVKVYAAGAGASAGTSILFPRLEYLY